MKMFLNVRLQGFFYAFTILFFIAITTKAQSGKEEINPYRYEITKYSTGSKGAVVSAHPLASQVGLNVLKAGGNAIDAAIATQLALAVVYPGAGNIGGGGFLAACLENGKRIAIDYRETAPAAAHRDMYLDAQGNPMLNKSQNGHLAAGVPGTVAGLFVSHQYGKLPFKTLIEPAIRLAELGFVITEAEARSLNSNQNDFAKYNTVTPVFIKHSSWKAGDTLVQKDLAETLRRIRDNGAKGFYEGETAELIVNEMKRAGGIISLEDLKNYKAKVRDVVEFPYKGHSIVSMPLPSSGGILLQQMLYMMDGKNLAKMKYQSPEAIQLMTEVERRAFADRAEYMGDADWVKVPRKTLVSKAYLEEKMKDYKPGINNESKNITAGRIAKESEETTHLSVADQWGNAVAVTTTLNGGYGSSTVVGGAGFLLNNEMDDFSVKPGVPNMYGALGSEANAIAPGKRMLSSMTPTIVLKNNKPYLIIGTPGGTTIPTSVFQTIVNIIDFDLGIRDAVNNPKFHHQWLPDEIMVEKAFSPATQDALKAMGYKIRIVGSIGRTEVIKITTGNSKKMKIEAVGDNRGDDDARTY